MFRLGCTSTCFACLLPSQPCVPELAGVCVCEQRCNISALLSSVSRRLPGARRASKRICNRFVCCGKNQSSRGTAQALKLAIVKWVPDAWSAMSLCLILTGWFCFNGGNKHLNIHLTFPNGLKLDTHKIIFHLNFCVGEKIKRRSEDVPFVNWSHFLLHMYCRSFTVVPFKYCTNVWCWLVGQSKLNFCFAISSQASNQFVSVKL